MEPLMATGSVVAVSVLAVVAAAALATAVVLWLRLRDEREAAERLREQVRALQPAEPGEVRPRSLQAAERAVRTVIGTAVKMRDQGVGGLLLSSIDDLSRWAMEDQSELARLAAEDGSVSIFFSDIEDSTALNTELGDEGWVQLLIAHDTLVRAHVLRRGGHIVKSQGDGFMIAFGSPGDAVRAALGIQRSLSEEWSTLMRRRPLRVRIGIHEGPVISRDGDYFGQSVAMAARIAAQAKGGQVLTSQAVATALAGDRRLSFRLQREVALKGFAGDHALWSVHRAGLRPLTPPHHGG